MVQEIQRIRTLEQLRGHTLEEVLYEVARNGESITVVLEEGETVVIQPAPVLKPLPELEGRVPEGWKDAIY